MDDELCKSTKKIARNKYLDNAGDAIIGGFGLPVSVEQQRVVGSTPGVGVTNTPGGDGNTLRNRNTGLSDSLIVRGRGTSDVELCRGNEYFSESRGMEGSV